MHYAISFRPAALAGCTSVTDDIHTAMPRNNDDNLAVGSMQLLLC